MPEPAGRILAIDYGRARVGLALSDPLGITAQPLAVLRVEDEAGAVERIAAIVAERGVRRLVIGLPLNMDGSEGPMVAEVRRFAAALATRCGIEPEEWDERLTSTQALGALGRSGMSWKKRKARLDAVAAQFLLQSFLDAGVRKS